MVNHLKPGELLVVCLQSKTFQSKILHAPSKREAPLVKGPRTTTTIAMTPTARFAATALALAAMAATTDAQACASLKQNTLTSAGCPATCGAASPCVLFAPSLNASLPCTEFNDASGKCLQQTDFTPPSSTSETCTVTYQCMEGIMVQSQWLLAVDSIKSTSKFSMAYVTEIKALKYSSAATLSVYVSALRVVTRPHLLLLLLLVSRAYL